MNITKLSNDMDAFAIDVSKELQEVYKDFGEDGDLDSPDAKAEQAAVKLNEICELLEGTKFDVVCEKLTDAMKDIADLAEGNVAIEVTDSDDVESAVQRDIEQEEEKHEMPRAMWGHD